MNILQETINNAMAYYNNPSWNLVLSIGAVIYLATYCFDRLSCLDKCLKIDANTNDIKKARYVIIAVFIWSVISLLILRIAFKMDFLICLGIFLFGWGAITLLFGRRYLKKVEDPEKKRYHFYFLLFPKDKK